MRVNPTNVVLVLLLLLLGTSTVFFTLLPRGEDSDKAQVYELSRRVSELEEALRKAQQGRVTDTSDDDDDDDDGATEEETPVKRQGKAGKDTAAVVDTGRDDEDVVTMLAKSRIGCYKDDFGKRDLPDFQRGMGAATPPKCMHRCAQMGFKYAGIQDGQECWCGNTYGSHGSSNECGTECQGDPDLMCGGSLANDVYPAKLLPQLVKEGFKPIDTAISKLRSKITCTGSSRENRLCYVKNLFYKVATREFILQIDNTDDISGVTLRTGELNYGISDHCSVTGIRGVDVKVVRKLDDAQSTLRWASGIHYFVHRFLPYNIMHVLHDDITGLFFAMVNYLENYSSKSADDLQSAPIDTDNRIIIVDEHASGDYKVFVNLLSDREAMHHGEFEPNTIVVFEEAMLGVSRRANWYQYGYGRPQGPIPNKSVDGKDVRLMADFLYKRFERYAKLKRLPSADLEDIVIFSRTRNRLIVNEKDLKAALEVQHPGLSVGYVRLESLTLWQVVHIMRNAQLAVGMHGSILILCMFMAEGSKIVELYPHAVPSNNYVPYKTMANLPGMNLRYAAWENRHLNNTIGYPDRMRLMGGVRELSPARQQEVIHATSVPLHFCCEDPFWLYKIFQDTIVTIPEVLALTK